MDYAKKIVKIAFIGSLEQSVRLQESLAETLRRKIKWDTFDRKESGSVDSSKYDAVVTAAGSGMSKRGFVRAISEILKQR